ncbi:serine/threonine-protein kinase A-Raf isoform X2 [Nematostella vectensis]|uniref:serine/threonine-protein kinase A-Raf isoform X2 n=1 Tax=Nematostella vectensis TaxID=45351 RepID=UPI002076FB5D|nr:serine/threonine-protein kinase A-Raf isoform X2 [Nematostella vectensis]
MMAVANSHRDHPCAFNGEENEDISNSHESEVRTVQHVIRLTKENLDQLNAQFSNIQHPPSIFLEEYQELTSKLSELKCREKHLLELRNGGSVSTSASVTPSSSSGPTSPTLSSRNSIIGSENPTSPPLRAHVRAFLPNQQRTMIKCQPGVTLKQALDKRMRMRGIAIETCLIFHCGTRDIISWDTHLFELEGEEISVEMIDDLPHTNSISHNFMRKTFFTLAYCDCCRRLLFTGFRCQVCGYKFHQRCAAAIPIICQQAMDDHDVYRRDTGPECILDKIMEMWQELKLLLAGRNEFDDAETTGHPKITRERSISAPNVCINAVGTDNFLEELYRSSQASRSQVATISAVEGNRLMRSSRHGRHKSESATHPRINDIFHDNNVHPHKLDTGSVGLPNGHAHQSERPPSPHKVPQSRYPRGRVRSTPDSDHKKRLRANSTDDWEILEGEVQMGPRIGSGSYGTVYKGNWHGAVAIKTLNVTDPTPTQLQAFKNEVAVLRKTRHVNVLLFMGCMSKPKLAIVTQWCEGSSLYRHLHVLENRFEVLNLIDIARQTAQGMDYLHAKKIIHRDLKSNNIFLQEDLTVKIGDFGLATIKTRWSGSQYSEQPSGSILWMAAEVIRMLDPNPYSFHSDVYAFGIVLYELLSSTLPYAHVGNKDQILYMVGRGYLRPDMSKARNDIPKAFNRLCLECIKFNRDERPLFPQILASLEAIHRALPKIQRSTSEPWNIGAKLTSDDVFFGPSVPETPISPFGGGFSFFSGGGY